MTQRQQLVKPMDLVLSMIDDDICQHRLRTLNEGINQRNPKFWADSGRQSMLRPYRKIWDWDLIFGRAMKAIFSLGVCCPWMSTILTRLRSLLLSTTGLKPFWSRFQIIWIFSWCDNATLKKDVVSNEQSSQ